jgi:hypothetical protein
MANFQRTVIYIGIVLIIIIVIIVGYTLYNSKATVQWPPLIGDCPDYWADTSGNGGNCVNSKGLGTCSASGSSMNFTAAPYVGSNGLCSKYKWATKCGLTWDGITSGVSNPCDSSLNST